MRPRAQSYHSYLSTEDRIFVYLITQPRIDKPAELVRYYIRYQTCFDGEWKDVVEYDNCHDKVHQHNYDRGGNKGPAKILGLNDDPKRSCEDLQEQMALLYGKFKEWYNNR